MRVMKVLTGTWLVCVGLGWGCSKMMPQLTAPGTPAVAVLYNGLIGLALWGLILFGAPLLALGWVVAFFAWLTRPEPPRSTPRDIAPRTQPAAPRDEGHRFLG
jgi:hypothetical protein